MRSRPGFFLDHLFMAVSTGGSEVEALERAGFTEGPSNVHPGQGTACRRFFFDNAYLEFLWLENLDEAKSPGIAKTALAQRLDVEGPACPLGVCGGTPGEVQIPVDVWPYRAPYLPSGHAIFMAANSSNSREPLLFFLPPGLSPRLPATEHRNGAREITKMLVGLPLEEEVSPELGWLVSSGLVTIAQGQPASLWVEMDGGRRGGKVVVPSKAPLTLVWYPPASDATVTEALSFAPSPTATMKAWPGPTPLTLPALTPTDSTDATEPFEEDQATGGTYPGGSMGRR